MTDLSGRVAGLSAKKRALLAQRLRAEPRAAAPSAIPRREGRGPVPLSFAQERLWFLDRWQPGNTAYNLLDAIRLGGRLEISALAAALAEVERRHESLRVVFAESGGIPYQTVNLPAAEAPPLLDLSALPRGRREPAAEALARFQGRVPFDLGRGPLWRARLVRLADEEHWLVLVMHHAVVDLWSFGILVGELATLYNRILSGDATPLPELPIQYPDFAAWQRRRLTGETLERQLAFWRRHLQGAPAFLELPTDRPRPAVQGFAGAVLPFTLPPRLLGRLKTLSQEAGGTLFMTAWSAFAVLLSRYCGQRDLLLGSVVAGRTRPEVEPLIGLFVNTVVLRADLTGELSFLDLLGRVRETVLEAFAHQELPFEKLVEELQPERDPARAPLVQVLFALQNAPVRPLTLHGLTLTPYLFDTGTAKLDLSLFLTEEEGALLGAVEYSTDLFDAARIHRLASHLRELLAGIAADPGRQLADLQLLSPAERRQLIGDWNDTAVLYPPVACLHHLFEAQADRSPEAVAAGFEEQVLTYRGLDLASNRLAHRLRSRGVGPEVVVGVLLERSLEMVVALFGILKAGGAYLPLDPSYPPERLAAFVEDAGPRLVLTVSSLAHLVPAGPCAVLLDDSGEGAAGAAGPASRLPAPAGPDALAYVIFTSGSTGRPKGAMNAHRGIVNRVLWMQEAYGLGPDDRVLQKTPFSFDVSVWEFFWPLAVGSCLMLARPGGHRDPAYLVELIAGAEITTLHFVPSMLQAFLEAPELARCAPLRRVITSGEELTAEVAGRCLERLEWAELHNLYGPTEAAVDVTAWPCRRGELGSRVPIGRPIANLRIHLLDAWEPVPLGVAGELFIGGVGVGRGYLGRPALTAERFVPDPLSAEPGGRLYRTGDLARHRVDGAVEFLGRVDHQVKIRGFRIELGEIEAALAQIPGVKAAVVGVQEERGDRKLVAYLAADEGVLAARAELRERLRARLPEAMVPAAFVVLPVLPLNPNGKVDRKALARLKPEVERQADAAEGPRTPGEELMAGIWSEILGLERVGLRASFFDLGGHSLLAMRVISRVRDTFGIELPLPVLFESPTVVALVERVERLVQERNSTGGPAAPPPLRPLPRTAAPDRFPASYAQERLWFLDRLEPGSSAYNIADALQVEGAYDVAAFAASQREIVRRHEALRTTFRLGPEGAEQVIAPPASASGLSVVDLAALPAAIREGAARRLAEQEAARPFDLERGPLLRLALIRTTADKALLLCNLHHIISDGWSMGVFFRELATLYRAFASGHRPELPELPVQYADYAVWQRSWLRGEVLAGQLEHWRRRLSGAPPVLELPWDRPRSAGGARRSAGRDLILDDGLAGAVHALCRQEQATLFMTLLGSFAALLHRLSGQEDLAIGTPVARRNRLETEGLIGFFVNTLVIRSEATGDPTFRDLLRRVRGTTLEAFQHQDLPFEKLVEELQPQRNLAASPLFQVMFVLQNAPLGDEGHGPAGEPHGSAEAHPGAQLIDRATAERMIRQFELPGLRLTPAPLGTNEVPFDLVLTLLEHERRIVGTLGFDAQLWDPATAERLIRQWRTLLAAAVERPETRWSDLPLLGTAERQQVLAEWNDTAAEPQDLCLHHFFERQAARTPAAEALVWGGERLTYGELDRRSRALAFRLRARGVRPERVVAVCAERSVGLVVALLGILRAGGAYAPLDPAYPRERLKLMLADSGAALVLASRRFAPEVAEWVSGRAAVLDLDDLDDPASGAAAPSALSAPVEPGVEPRNVAYLIFTSGSTGRPKGVAIEHRSAAALVCWARAVFPAEDLRGVLFATSINFDLSIFELFVPLAWGGKVILADNALALPALPAAGEVTLINTVPSALAELVREGRLPAGVRTINLAGEPLSRDLADRIHGLPAAPRLFNLYGPSEDTTYSTGVQVPQQGGKPSIGRPISGTRAYVLDRWGQTSPVGAFGELFLGGAGLARGYWGRPDLTAERFVPDAFGCGARLYRTGDLVRWRHDGELEFLGRIDRQVKVRGFRIELAEVEAVLAAHPEVREAAALVDDHAEGGRLAACVVAEPGTSPAPDDLRRHLQTTLPDSMIPSVFRFLEALPLTPSGKVDRQALASLAPPAPPGVTAAARTPVEHMLAAIWAEALHVAPEGIGAADDFFLLGGHSLLATRVVSRITAAFGVEVPLRLLFERPTLERFAAALEEAVRGGGRPALPPLTRVARQGPLPLSFAQERLWFLDQLEPGSAAYNIPGALQLDGGLDVRALADSLTEIVRRHEVLRTIFRAADGLPVQEALPAEPFVLPVCDLSDLAPALQESGVRSLLAEEASRPFDLAAGPVLRVVLLRLAAARHVVLFNMHHIASDAWSLEVLARELAALYPALVAGKASPLPTLPVQYADFAVWQRSWLTGEELERQLAHWREHLAGAAPQLDLPTDRPRERSAGGSAGTVPIEVSDELARALAAAGRREGTTLFMVLLAAFQAVLSRVASQMDITVGAPIAGRTRLETEALIGFFVNTLALRTFVDGAEELGSLLRRVRRTVVAAFIHQDLPFERLVEALQPERSLHSTPLFQVLFNFQIGSAAAIDLPGLRLTPAPLAPIRTKFDLTLAGTADRERLELALTYNRELFDRATVARLGYRLEIFLAALVETPYRRIADVEVLAPAERHQLLVDWGRGPSTPVSALCLHQLFEAQVDRTPQAPALVFEDEALSYAELDVRANRLAHRLLRLGVTPEDRVGIFLERSGDAVVAFLAVLKAGGAYVPLDPAWPAPRLAGLIGEAGVQVVVTRERLLSLLPALPALLPFPLEAAGAGDGSGGRPGLPLDHRQIAYLLFTSGSTGRPKGVAVEHRQIVHYVGAVLERLELAEPSSFALVSTLSADLGNTSLFPALATGGALHVLSAERATDPEGMADYFERHRIDCLKIVPSHLRALRTGSRPHAVLPRRRLILGGEALSWQEADELAALVPDCTVLNHYGPTESTVGVTTCRLAEAARRGGTVPLGRPLRNVQVYLLDSNGQPTPPGTPGDLHLGGAGLARGYWGRPDLTAERFLPYPFGDVPGARLYRTGDRVLFTPEGLLQFLGRLDHQVKVRGFRIELGEIEAALAELPTVREAAVVVRGEGEARRLAAYVVSASGEDLAIPQLRDALRERLPEPMVPGEWQILPRLPLNANGKVDRRALPAPEQMTGSGSPPPRDEIEIGLAQVWEGLLGSGPVGAHDSFFELGGQSLLAVRLLARIERRFGRRLALADLMQSPTVAQMARRLRSGELARTSSILVPIQPNGAAPPLFWVHPVGGSIFCYLELARRLGDGQPSYALQAPRSEYPEVRLEALAASYLEEVRKVQPAGPYRLAGWSMGGVLAFEMARQLEAEGEGVSLLTLLDVGLPVPCTDEPEDPATELLLFTRDLGRLLANPAAVDPARFERLVSEEPSLERLWATPVLRAALPADLDLEQVQELFAVFLRNRRIVRAYHPVPYGGALTLIRAAESEVEEGALVAGWGGLAGGGVEVAVVPGDHYSILRAPGLEELVLLLAERLERPGSVGPPGVRA